MWGNDLSFFEINEKKQIVETQNVSSLQNIEI